MATPAQLAANRSNARRSTGPKSVEGKESARRNALKHGLTGGGVVVPGEDEHEVTIRVAALETQLVPEGDVMAALMVRQVAMASIRSECAFRHETAQAAERTMFKVLHELRLARAEGQVREPAIAPLAAKAITTETPATSEVRSELGSFCTRSRERLQADERGVVEAMGVAPHSSFASFSVGRAPV